MLEIPESKTISLQAGKTLNEQEGLQKFFNASSPRVSCIGLW